MTEETFGWIFIDKTPLLYDKKRVEKQKQIETWLDLYQLTTELNIQKTKQESSTQTKPLGYIV